MPTDRATQWAINGRGGPPSRQAAVVQSRGHREIRGFRDLLLPTQNASPNRDHPRKRAAKAYTLVQGWGEMVEVASSSTLETTPNRHQTCGNGSCSPSPPPHAKRSAQGDAQLTAISITGLSVENGGGCAGPAPVPCTHAPPRTHTLPSLAGASEMFRRSQNFRNGGKRCRDGAAGAP